MKLWEYAEEYAKTEEGWTDLLNTHGDDGWELVAITDDDPGEVRLVFKRPRTK